ncbi:hypothetical protein [Ferrovibrio sp.]|uniref:hypothetical protein n=1 Tax=Ferrovibrio sp. TaxID=1917215 RepID=UPI003D0A01C4
MALVLLAFAAMPVFASDGRIPVSDLNVVFINVDLSQSQSNVRDDSEARRMRDTMTSQQHSLRNAVVDKLPALLAAKGLPAQGYAVEFDMRGNPIRPAIVNPQNHLLVIAPASAQSQCRRSACFTVFTVTLRLLAPGVNVPLWESKLKEPISTLWERKPEARFDEFLAEIAGTMAKAAARQ